ncbi:20S proteasome, regulatory subunit alpha type PSMA1/PRE5 [Trachipleistophora hominis]|uniref:20S proteasome, regulatory subunit alpha type PSMA1/PRE5 n=1 Tax=Trachipleistophora hominis TaxID=72359 RepID=L7JTW8_TRAHO|nr:20S proteasome, regulatory subunit alpha type PSMA1/PRE5 [Trachipleistophora hominis]
MSTYTEYAGVSIYAPDGKVSALSHVQQSISLGSTALCITNHKQSILLCHHHSTSKLQHAMRKVFVRKNLFFTFSGITNDGLELIRYILDEMSTQNVWKNTAIDPMRAFNEISVSASARTLISSDRLYGCGGILGVEYRGKIKVVEWMPTGTIRSAKAVAIGNRAQSCRTVLEKYFEENRNVSNEDMLDLAMSAMRNAHGQDGEMKRENLEGYILKLGEHVKPIEDLGRYL